MACDGNSVSQSESTQQQVDFTQQQIDYAQQQIDSASSVVKQEIDNLLSSALLAATELANHQELGHAIASDNRDEALRIANELKRVRDLDFITLTDNNGIVLVRTINPLSLGDNIAHFPPFKSALNGNTISSIETNDNMRLSTIACAPIYDDNMNLIGVFQSGCRLDEQQFALRIKELTGCEVEIYHYNERIATTIMDEDGMFTLGARDDAIERVLAGETHTEEITIFGNKALIRYDPLFSADNQVVGIISVAEFIPGS